MGKLELVLETDKVCMYSLLLGSFEGKLCLCDWMAEEHRLLADRRLERSLNAEMKDIPSEITAKAAQELDEYFAGGRKSAIQSQRQSLPSNDPSSRSPHRE